jgi:hypothetical protein
LTRPRTLAQRRALSLARGGLLVPDAGSYRGWNAPGRVHPATVASLVRRGDLVRLGGLAAGLTAQGRR